MKTNTQDNAKILAFLSTKSAKVLPTKKARGYKGKVDLRKVAGTKTRTFKPRSSSIKNSRVTIIDSKKIHIISQLNPRREGTHGFNNFNLYREGMTVADFRAIGLGMNHFVWDLEHNFISLS